MMIRVDETEFKDFISNSSHFIKTRVIHGYNTAVMEYYLEGKYIASAEYSKAPNKKVNVTYRVSTV